MTINRFDNNKKKTLINRTITSIFISIYYLFILIFAIFGDDSPFSIASGITNQQTIAISSLVLVFVFYIPIPVAIYEVNRIIFKGSWISYFVTLSLISFMFLFPTLFYVVSKNFIDAPFWHKTNLFFNQTLYFVSCQIIGTIIIFISSNLILLLDKQRNNKKRMTFLFLLAIIWLGFLSLTYIGLTRSWNLLFLIFFTIGITDVFCYIFGSFFGKTKLAPNISPNKTIEGFFGGWITAILLSLTYIGLLTLDKTHYSFDKITWTNPILLMPPYDTIHLPDPFEWLLIILIIMFLSWLSVCGDLTFSYIKRKFDIKDYGTLLKSHGGVLDRFDSILFTSSIYSIFMFSIAPIILYWSK